MLITRWGAREVSKPKLGLIFGKAAWLKSPCVDKSKAVEVEVGSTSFASPNCRRKCYMPRKCSPERTGTWRFKSWLLHISNNLGSKHWFQQERAQCRPTVLHRDHRHHTPAAASASLSNHPSPVSKILAKTHPTTPTLTSDIETHVPDRSFGIFPSAIMDAPHPSKRCVASHAPLCTMLWGKRDGLPAKTGYREAVSVARFAMTRKAWFASDPVSNDQRCLAQWCKNKCGFTLFLDVLCRVQSGGCFLCYWLLLNEFCGVLGDSSHS